MRRKIKNKIIKIIERHQTTDREGNEVVYIEDIYRYLDNNLPAFKDAPSPPPIKTNLPTKVEIIKSGINLKPLYMNKIKTVGIAADNYKLNKFKKVLKEEGFSDFKVKKITALESLIKIKTTADRIPDISKICKEIELFFKKGN